MANWRRWALRRALSPWIVVPCRVVTDTGNTYIFGRDFIDDYVLEDVLGPLREIYFPSQLRALSKPLILDVGAHSGILAIEVLRLIPESRVIAVEPSPRVSARLRRNLNVNRMDDRCEVVEAAIADHHGTVMLRRSRDGSWGDSTYPGSNEPNYALGGVPVITTTLAGVLKGRQPDAVFCNAEGAEFAVVPQLIGLGLRPRVLVLMTHSKHGNPTVLLNQLRVAGFAVNQVGDDPEHFHCAPTERLST